MQEFNPKLTEWLNDKSFTSDEWPDNLPESVKKLADKEVGAGYLLDDMGWPMIGFNA